MPELKTQIHLGCFMSSSIKTVAIHYAPNRGLFVIKITAPDGLELILPISRHKFVNDLGIKGWQVDAERQTDAAPCSGSDDRDGLWHLIT